MSEQPREGGRFKAKPPPAPTRIPTPAHDKLAAMEAKRCSNPDRFVVVPPVPLSQLNTIGTVRHGVAITPEGRELASKSLIEHLYAWLRQVAEEGIPGDLERAWYAFDPPVSCVKSHHRSIYDELAPQCLRRTGELYRAWEKERQALQAAASMRHAIELQREAIAKAELASLEMPAKLEAQRARLAELEAMA